MALSELEMMSTFWLKLLTDAGWVAPMDELTMCTTDADEMNWKITVNGFTVKRASRKEGFKKVLGTVCTFDGNLNKELDMRIRKAWGQFWKQAFFKTCCIQLIHI